MKYALFVIFEKAAKFEIVVCCKLLVALYGLILLRPLYFSQGLGYNFRALFFSFAWECGGRVNNLTYISLPFKIMIQEILLEK